MLKLLTAVEVGTRLALSPVTIRGWVRAGRLPAVRVGRMIRVREDDLEALLRFGAAPGWRRMQRR